MAESKQKKKLVAGGVFDLSYIAFPKEFKDRPGVNKILSKYSRGLKSGIVRFNIQHSADRNEQRLEGIIRRGGKIFDDSFIYILCSKKTLATLPQKFGDLKIPTKVEGRQLRELIGESTVQKIEGTLDPGISDAEESGRSTPEPLRYSSDEEEEGVDAGPPAAPQDVVDGSKKKEAIFTPEEMKKLAGGFGLDPNADDCEDKLFEIIKNGVSVGEDGKIQRPGEKEGAPKDVVETLGSNKNVLNVLKKTRIDLNRRKIISNELAHHKKVIAPTVLRNQREAASFKRVKFHINPVGEEIKKRRKSLHPNYKSLRKVGII